MLIHDRTCFLSDLSLNCTTVSGGTVKCKPSELIIIERAVWPSTDACRHLITVDPITYEVMLDGVVQPFVRDEATYVKHDFKLTDPITYIECDGEKTCYYRHMHHGDWCRAKRMIDDLRMDLARLTIKKLCLELVR